MVTRRGAHTGIAAAAALVMVALLPGTVGVASAADVPAYETAPGATPITGRPGTDEAPRLEPGLHTDRIGRNEQKVYEVKLDAKSSAYFSVVAAPKPGTKVEEYKDRLTVKVQDANGSTCSAERTQSFHAGGTAYPIGDYASRDIGGTGTQCKAAGLYYVVVTREGSPTSGPAEWPIELGYVQEPPIKGTAPTAPRTDGFRTTTPPPRTDTDKRQVRGGTGFNDAGRVDTGVWRDRIMPGETRFYRVPVTWGQRLNLTADLPNSAKPGTTRFVANALGLNVFNPARGVVISDNFVMYEGKGAQAKEFTAPVDYANRFGITESAKAMRFPGWYYLEVTLNAEARSYFPKGTDLTLRVDVKGAAKAGPTYAGPAPGFTDTDPDGGTASGPQEAESGTLRVVAYAGIGTGVVLLTGLGAWTLVARRKAVGAAAVPGTPGTAGSLSYEAQQPTQPRQHQQGGGSQQFGPPQG
ncbi:hypothetical protein [Streptomyces natalensis]|uniref:Aromatic ring-opening dioxygenase LigA n=1 Tax=Streptomyces natalensis ATCC 27448 TaxID=1240678 RepID=A0A0D7CU82_9ACTN|nr:hypothetical protein [Streptomyces natalensis]KIZ19405.1 hypothetical protein SNA_02455 [Streptomyces natalensis ATCC 27448]